MQLTIEQQFGQHLREALKSKYGRVPSAAFVALQFGRLSGYNDGVSGESVRRWMRGTAMPKYRHMKTLAMWLGIHTDAFFKPEAQSQTRPASRLEKLISNLQPELEAALVNFLEHHLKPDLDWKASASNELGEGLLMCHI